MAEDVRASRDARVDGQLKADAAFLVCFLRHLAEDPLQTSDLLRVETRALSEVSGKVGGDAVFANAADVESVEMQLRKDEERTW